MGYYVDQGCALTPVPTTWNLMRQNPSYSSYGYDNKTDSIFANANIPLGFIEVEALWRLSVADLMRDFSATAMTIKALKVKGYSFVRAPATAVVDFNFYANGLFGNLQTTYPQGSWGLIEGYSPTPLNIATDGVPLYPYITVGIYHYLSANSLGFTEVLSANPEVLIDYETPQELYLTNFTSLFEEIAEPYTKITIEGTKYSQTTDAVGNCQMHLPTGTYTAVATKKDSDKNLVGKQDFTVPDDSIIMISMSEKGWLPDWWWMVPVAIGGVLIIATVVPTLTRRKERIIVVS